MSTPPNLEEPSSNDPVLAGPEAPAGAAVRAAIDDGVRRLIAAEPEALHGDVEGVHQMRVATRRLRSDLRTFRTLIDPDWAAPLREELKWLGRALGDVRELDVLTARLRSAAGKRAGALAPIFGPLDAQHAEARSRLDAALRSDRFAALKGRLMQAARRPELAVDHAHPCREVLPGLVASTWKRLARRGRALRRRDPEEDFHEVRIRAKRARYAAEAVAPALDPAASKAALKFAEAAKVIQDILGEHQDAVVARATVERLAAAPDGSSPDGFPRALERLRRTQARAAREARRRFTEAWRQVDRPKRLAWLRSDNAPDPPQT